LGGAIASGGGVGGGAVYIPVFILVMRFTPQVAVPLSKVMIFGVAIGGYIVLARKRHPKADRPLIDYSIALLMEPLTLAGTIVGVYMNITFPGYLLIVFLVILLSITAYRTFQKGFTLYKEEKAAPKSSEIQPILRTSTIIQDGGGDDDDDDDVTAAEKDLADIMKKERGIPWLKFLSLAVLEAGMLVLVLMKGGSDSSIVGIKCGSWQYWAIVATSFPYLFFFVGVVSRILNAEHKQKVKVGYTYLKEDLKWNGKTIFLFLCFSVLAGIAAGFLGIGGGLITGPVLIEMGVISQVATATSSYMILFTSSATTVQFIILGRLPWKYAVWYFCTGVLAAIIGQFGVAEIIKRYKKQAFVNFLLAFIIVLSVVLMTGIEGWNIYNNVKEHNTMGFHPVCGGV